MVYHGPNDDEEAVISRVQDVFSVFASCEDGFCCGKCPGAK